MNGKDSRMMVSGEVAGLATAAHTPSTSPAQAAAANTPPATAQALPAGVKSFGQTQAGAERLLPRFKLSDLDGETITVQKVEDFNGKFGPGYRVVVIRESTGEKGVLLGHWTVIGKYLEAMQADGDLPVSCKVFKASGKRYFDFADPLQPTEPAQG